MLPNALVYDIEIERGILDLHAPPEPGIEYCAGWEDHVHMGVSVVGAYDYVEGRYRVFCKDNLPEFKKLCEARALLVGFNTINFDNAVLRTVGVSIPEAKCYDLLREAWAALGFGPKFDKSTHAGYGLDAISKSTLGVRKTGYGGHAPVAWQQGRIGEVIDYCLNDVRLTVGLFDLVVAGKPLVNPKTGGELTLRKP